jgi:hypothetical protein
MSHPLQKHEFTMKLKGPQANTAALKAFADAHQWGTVPLTIDKKAYTCIVTDTGENNMSCVPIDQELEVACSHTQATGPLPGVPGLTCTLMPSAFKNS